MTTFSFLSRFVSGWRWSPPPVSFTVRTPRLIIVVEGRHDIEFLRRISTILHSARPELPDLAHQERLGSLLFVPAGGGDYRPWLRCLAGLGRAQFYLHDREVPPVSQEREQWAASVNTLPGRRAVVTRRRSLENYLHREAIYEARGVSVQFTASDDVAELAARSAFRPTNECTSWDQLSRRARRRQRDRVKRWLNTEAVDRMTVDRLDESDPNHEIIGWLRVMRESLGG